MATLPDFQGQGLGRAVINHSLDQVWAAGGQLLWCNARLIAVDFYKKLGFATIGTEFTIPSIGPHLVMFVERPPAV
jgi:GNAT superfamily N-acetyltransferase